MVSEINEAYIAKSQRIIHALRKSLPSTSTIVTNNQHKELDVYDGEDEFDEHEVNFTTKVVVKSLVPVTVRPKDGCYMLDKGNISISVLKVLF